MKKTNPKLLGIIIVAAVILIFIGFKATSSSEDKEMIKKAETEMENGKFDSAEATLVNASGGKAKKLHEALKVYNSATTNFFNNYDIPVFNDITESGYNTGFEETFESINDINSSYKKYSAFKTEVNSWKDWLKTAMKLEKDLRKDYNKMKTLKEEKEYDKCSEQADEWNAKIMKEFSAKESDDTSIVEIFVDRLKAFTYGFDETSLMSNSDYSDNSSKSKSEPTYFEESEPITEFNQNDDIFD